MSESHTSPPPQTSNIFVDRPCLKCGYNLRGQTATWSRRALNWQVTCPECGGVQVVVLGSAERGERQPLVTLALVVLGVWLLWQLFDWLSISIVGMSPPAVLFAPDLDATIIHAGINVVPVALSAFLLSLVIAVAPYASSRQRNFCVDLLVIAAAVYALHLDLAGLYANPAASIADWQVKAAPVTAVAGGAIALAFGRFGLAVGRPLAKMVVGMYVKAEP